MTYKYKVGDRVKIRNDLISGALYGMENNICLDFVDEEMESLKGKIAIIEKCNYEGSGKYKIKGSYRYWTDGMFEEKKRFNGLEE